MHRICHDLGWVDTASFKQGPDKTRVILESWLPKALWPEINLIVVGFGQQAQQHRPLMLKRICGADGTGFPARLSVRVRPPSLRLRAPCRLDPRRFLAVRQVRPIEAPFSLHAMCGLPIC